MENSARTPTTSRRGFITKASLSGLAIGLVSGNALSRASSTKDINTRNSLIN
jgi:hypothetical protein